MLRPVPEVADLEKRLGIFFFVLVPSNFVETAVEHVGLSVVAKEAGAWRFIVACSCLQSTFFETSFWAVGYS